MNNIIRCSCVWIYLGCLVSTVSTTTSSGEVPPDGHMAEIAAAKWEFQEFVVHITVILFLLAMILLKMIFHRIPYLPEYMPESLLLIIVGIIFGAFVRYVISANTVGETVWQLTPRLFFYYLLPPIVLEASYSLYNRTFSEYLGVVLIFAVVGTILNFLLIGFCMNGLLLAGALGDIKDKFDLKGMLLFSSLIVAVDPVAVLAIFQDIGVELSLYYIVFGESLLNDAITVVLYDIMSAFAGTDNVTGQQIAVGIASFFTVSFGGLLIGVVVGIISCLITRIKSHLNAFTLILLAYFSYIMADCVGWSGIISMIGCGLVQAAYAFHNLDHKSVTLVHKLTKLVAEVSESVIFLFLGVEVLRGNIEWQSGFILWSLVLCLFARAVVVLAITAAVNAVQVDNTKISFTEQVVLIYGGLRGAVSFSLSILIVPERLGPSGQYSRHVMITATMFIILFTVGFMGVTMKPLVKLLKIRMQTKRKLSLFNVLNENVLDEALSSVEIIAAEKGRNVVRDFFMRLDEKYVRRILQRNPEMYDHKLMRVYEKIALKLHFASLQPNQTELILEDIPEALKAKYMKRMITSDSLASIEKGTGTRPMFVQKRGRWAETGREKQTFAEVAAQLVDHIRSTRRASIGAYGKPRATVDEALSHIIKSHKKGLLRKQSSTSPKTATETTDAQDDHGDEADVGMLKWKRALRAAQRSKVQPRIVSRWSDVTDDRDEESEEGIY
ncbi:hypothetical protein CRM22_004390 [Opisthorchis felineus]|uniref:Sodium/hydrogen exchanger n=1 Tax=Opisthorchis felineus TaxID=147828 RepID=A0A4S2LWF4_OPIFE|nr:hypothetical protein CRM22_004390 [Opisthorchis felineus]